MKPRWTLPTERLVSVAVARLVRLFRSAGEVVVIAACYGLLYLTRVLCLLGLPQCFFEGWRIEMVKNPRDAGEQRRLTLLYGGYVLKYLGGYVRIRMGYCYWWWIWLRVAHKHGWEKAGVDAKCRFWGFKFMPDAKVDATRGPQTTHE